MTPEEINQLLANSRNQKFRKKSEAQVFVGQSISISRKGQESNHKGKERSFKGKPRQNKSVASHSEESKLKISQSKLGKPSHKKGATTPKEVIEKLCKKIQTPDGIFNSRNEAAIFYNIKPATLSFRLKKYPDQYFYI